MLKKTTVCLSVLLGICVLHVSAAATTSDHIVKINAFNKIYYGTISPDKNSGNSTFTALENSDGLSSIYGKWKKNSFSGNCDISYNNGHILSVEYNKKGLVSNTVTDYDSSGNFQTYSCSNGKPYGKITCYNSDSVETATDWFYLCTPLSEWKKQAQYVSYTNLINNPYEYIDLPVKITGTVEDIYETSKQAYLKILDTDNNTYLFKCNNKKTNKYAPSNIKNVTIGDSLSICGIYTGLSDFSETNSHLYNQTLGYKSDFSKLKDQFVSPDFLAKYNILFEFADSELLDSLPLFDTVYADVESDSNNFHSNHLTNSYQEICDYPFYYADHKVSLTGTVVYENNEAASEELTLLLEEDGTKNIYALSVESTDYTSYLHEKISCTGTLNGNNKIPYCNTNSISVGYALFPNVDITQIQVSPK